MLSTDKHEVLVLRDQQHVLGKRMGRVFDMILEIGVPADRDEKPEANPTPARSKGDRTADKETQESWEEETEEGTMSDSGAI